MSNFLQKLVKPLVTPDEFQPYTCSYVFEHQQFVFQIWARSWEEAQARIEVLSEGRVDGVLCGEYPAVVASWVPSWCYLVNTLKGILKRWPRGS